MGRLLHILGGLIVIVGIAAQAPPGASQGLIEVPVSQPWQPRVTQPPPGGYKGSIVQPRVPPGGRWTVSERPCEVVERWCEPVGGSRGGVPYVSYYRYELLPAAPLTSGVPPEVLPSAQMEQQMDQLRGMQDRQATIDVLLSLQQLQQQQQLIRQQQEQYLQQQELNRLRQMQHWQQR